MRGMSDKLPRANRKYRHILSIVKKIIDNQGESIWVEYSAGEGATFDFTWHKNPPSQLITNRVKLNTTSCLKGIAEQ